MNSLTLQNISSYFNFQYPQYQNYKLIDEKRIGATPFLQSNYGEENDCTIMSIATCIYYYVRQINMPIPMFEIYAATRKIAKKYKYNDSTGTFFGFNKKIYEETLKYFNLKQKININFVKNVGFNFNTIKKSILENKPVVLSMANDGRDYYKNHTVTIIGYQVYELNDTDKNRIIQTKKINKNMLLVFDN